MTRWTLPYAQTPQPQTALTFTDADFKAQSISDAVAISTAVNPSGLSMILRSLEQLTLDLLMEGYLIRGALVKGKLYHDDKMVFGEALVRAFELESNVAVYPRVMIVREIVDEALASGSSKQFADFVRQADDGPFFLHSLRHLSLDIQKHKGVDFTTNSELVYYVQIGEKLRQRLNEAADNPRHFEKVAWFAKYWNEVIRSGSVKGLEVIRAPGVDLPVAVWG